MRGAGTFEKSLFRCVVSDKYIDLLGKSLVVHVEYIIDVQLFSLFLLFGWVEFNWKF